MDVLLDLCEFGEKLEQCGKTKNSSMSRNILFSIDIDKDGNILDVYPITSEKKFGNKIKTCLGISRDIPTITVNRTNNFFPYMFVDTTKNISFFEYTPKGKNAYKEIQKDKIDKIISMYLKFEKEIDDVSYSAVCRYFEKLNEKSYSFIADKLLSFCKTNSPFGMLTYNTKPICDNEKIISWWKNGGERKWIKEIDENAFDKAYCFDTKEISDVFSSYKHDRSINLKTANNCKLVSFNESNYISYNQEPTKLFPISIKGVCDYASALNYMVNNKNHCIFLDDSTFILHWSDVEGGDDFMAEIFGDDYSSYTSEEIDKSIDTMINNAKNGKLNQNDIEGNFYILKLQSFSTRLRVIDYTKNSIKFITENSIQHCKNATLRGEEQNYTSVSSLFNVVFKYGNIPDRNVFNEKYKHERRKMFEAVFYGKNYPEKIFVNFLDKFSFRDKINASDISIIFGYLQALLIRNYNMTEEDIKKSMYINLGMLISIAEIAYENYKKKTSGGKGGSDNMIKNKYYNWMIESPMEAFNKIVQDITVKYDANAVLRNKVSDICSNILKNENFNGTIEIKNDRDKFLMTLGMMQSLINK